MKREDIIKTWREAGFNTIPEGSALQKLQRFVELVAASEREVCAKVCDEFIDRIHGMRDADESMPEYQPELAGRQAGAARCAAAIRARGKQ